MAQAEDDYWLDLGTVPPATAEEHRPVLSIEELQGIDPLDAQFGVWPQKTVPDSLYRALFGQTDPALIEGKAQGGEPAEELPLQTYAILDAAKFTGGLSELERCGVRFQCLFKGDTAEELKDVAPYLFQLSADADFTRCLMTHIPTVSERMTSVHAWHMEPGIYFRSTSSFEEIWSQFRKFTRIKDQKLGWIYYRFWDPRILLKLTKMKSLERPHWLWRMFVGIESMIFIRKSSTAILTVPQDICERSKGMEIRAEDILAELRFVKLDIFCEDMAEKIGSDDSLGFLDRDTCTLVEKVTYLTEHARTLGLTEERSVERYVTSCHILNMFAESNPEAFSILTGGQHELDKSRRLLEISLKTLES
ncbi:DUF4123 domain-containing protein [Leisingera sp. S132]|uniref:DUF4123 domain-containing protein n=1 Tax=Leisingera sp. S132 TaxID=2867016 RepID=UPI0021A85D42|nr:DUF4123 domain-containing protein [Leisingera sp. S132]UWQ77953.1 DUF4123 domain-containing protein [Leisingera sp. S132]